MSAIHDLAQGRWKDVLQHHGLTARELSGKHAPCPICGGKDRFRFTNFQGKGDWICTQCGHGSGVDLLMQVKHLSSYGQVLELVEDALGKSAAGNGSSTKTDHSYNYKTMNNLWQAATECSADGPVTAYLGKRGLAPVSRLVMREAIVEHSAGGMWPCMLARVVDQWNVGVNIHRTYLTHLGDKAPVDPVRKTMPGPLPEGCCVRLMPCETRLGIAEGIETALAAARLHSMPVWAALNANRLGVWSPPEGVRHVVIFGDNDASYTGQKYVYHLAHRLVLQGIKVEIAIPDRQGDWNDELLREIRSAEGQNASGGASVASGA